MNKEKFKAYWESIGKPVLEICNVETRWITTQNPDWTADYYRIKGDQHWELRQKWIESDFTLPIETFIEGDKYGEDRWSIIAAPKWIPSERYREKPNASALDLPCIGIDTAEGKDETVFLKVTKNSSAKIETEKLPTPDLKGLFEDMKNLPDEFKDKKPEDTVRSFREYVSDMTLEKAQDELGTNHPMYAVFMDAITQATSGKGERHGGARTPFLDQRWHNISKSTGFRSLVYQACKKMEEACGKETYADFERELLGGLVYGAMAVIHTRLHGYTKEVKVDD